MNFSGFQLWREQCLRELPNVIDCAETNLYRALSHFQPKPAAPGSDHPVYRCDLARAWLRHYGFPEDGYRHALICRGVRHALSLIFRELAKVPATVFLPGDVYPVYLELASNSGIEPRIFPTLPEPRLPGTPAADGPEYLLITNPLKPLGRFLTEAECDQLAAWLKASPDRHLLVDCVYDLQAPFHHTTRKLWETGRAILLHSITKGWLLPKTFGVALIPAQYQPLLTQAFRNDSPSAEQLRLVEKLFLEDINLPGHIVAELCKRRSNLMAVLPMQIQKHLLLGSNDSAPSSYFFPVKIPAEELLQQHRILAIPADAFGGSWGGSILTSLARQ